MFVTLLPLVLYLLVGAAAVAVVRWLGRPLPIPYPLALWVLPIVFAFPGFFAARTILPVDHAMLLPPWSETGQATRYNPNLNDAATQLAPWAKAVRMSWKEGSPPLRQRWNGCGMPLAANAQSAAFSPLTLLMLPLPLARAFTLAAAVKLFLALLGTWLWLSELGVSRGAALFGAVCFGLSCTMTPWILFPHTSVICLWPWALFAIEPLCKKAVRLRALVALTAIVLFWLLAGHPESVALGAGFCVLWLLARALFRDLPEPSRVFGRVALCAAAAIGLSAPVLLSEAFAIAASNRVPLAESFVAKLPFRLTPHGPFWRNGLVTAFFPRAFGDGIGSPMIEGGVASFPKMALGYFGITGWALALAILRPGCERRRTELALLAPLLFGLGVSIGLWPVFEAVLATPVLRMMSPLRFFTWVALAGSAIAALELDRIRRDLAARRKSAAVFLAIPAGLVVFALASSSRSRALHAAAGGLLSQNEARTVALICLGATAAAFIAALWKPGARVVAVFSLSLSLIAAAELLYQGMRLYRFGSPADLYPDTPMLAFLRSRPGPFRIVGEGAVLFPNSNVFAGLEDIRTHDPVERRDYVDFLNATCGYPPGDYFKQIRDINASSLDFLNVRYLLSAPKRAEPGEKWRLVYSGQDGTVFENRDALPRVFVPARITLIGGAENRPGWTRNAFAQFGAPASAIAGKKDWREHAFVLARETKQIVNGLAQITEYRESTNEVSFRVRVSGETPEVFLVASLTQDGGWSARDQGGRRIDTTLANGPFLALRVGSGDHLVSLKYSPPGFQSGIEIAALSLLAMALRPTRRAIARLPSSPLERTANWPRAGRIPWIWLAGATVVLIAGLSTSRLLSSGSLPHIPATPLDLTNDRLARIWSYLKEVRERVPDGATYTVIASDPSDEMYLYMFSLGLFEKQRALPTSYFGVPQPFGRLARYVLAYGGASPQPEGTLLLVRVKEGAVYERALR